MKLKGCEIIGPSNYCFHTLIKCFEDESSGEVNFDH